MRGDLILSGAASGPFAVLSGFQVLVRPASPKALLQIFRILRVQARYNNRILRYESRFTKRGERAVVFGYSQRSNNLKPARFC
jgi:hypothetical protein